MAWSHISMDFIEGLPKSNGKDVILVVVDRLTKYSHFLPLSHPYTAHKVAQLFIDNIYKLHGLPTTIVFDRDRPFANDLWQHLFKSLNVSLRFSSAYHPQSDGQTECVNQCLEVYLRCMAHSEPRKWYYWLPLDEWWYNTNYHSSLQCTPFQALYGYAPPLISEVSIPDPDSPAKYFLLEKQAMLQRLKAILSQARARMKKYVDNNRTERSFAVGDMVYFKMQPYCQVAFDIRNALKHTTEYYGPFRVLEKIGTVAYKLQLPSSAQIHHVFHVSQLKKHVGPKAIPSPNLPLVDADGRVKFQPIAVLSTRALPRNHNMITQWLVQWDGSPRDDAT